MKLADGALNVHRLWRLGDAQWSETLVDFSNRSFNEVSRLQCGERLGAQLTKSCGYKITLVVESKNGRGQVRYAEAVDLEGARDPSCVAYSGCIAAGYVDKEISMPNRDSDFEALTFHVEALRREDLSYDLDDPEFLRLTIETMQEDYDRLSARDWRANARHRFVVPNLRNEISYMKRKLAELE